MPPPKSDYTFRNSRLFKPGAREATRGAGAAPQGFFFFCNSLEEKKKFIYFKKGPSGSVGSECGLERNKMRKADVTWTQIDDACANGLAIWKVEEAP
ncbi:hypothetical protein GCM10027299_32690 [Larkinella ripae]